MSDAFVAEPPHPWRPSAPLATALLSAIQNRRPCRIVFLGDSLTSAEWVHPNWREVVEYALKQCAQTAVDDWRDASWLIRCFNAGFDGATTRDWLDRLDGDIVSLRPEIVIVTGTRNDWEFDIPEDESRRNLGQLFDRLKESGVPNVAYAPSFADLDQARVDQSQRYFAAMLSTAQERAIPTVDLLGAMAGADLDAIYTFVIHADNPVTGELAGGRDLSHPNALGNCQVGAIMLKALFDIDFDAVTYLDDLRAGLKYPRFIRVPDQIQGAAMSPAAPGDRTVETVTEEDR